MSGNFIALCNSGTKSTAPPLPTSPISTLLPPDIAVPTRGNTCNSMRGKTCNSTLLPVPTRTSERAPPPFAETSLTETSPTPFLADCGRSGSPRKSVTESRPPLLPNAEPCETLPLPLLPLPLLPLSLLPRAGFEPDTLALAPCRRLFLAGSINNSNSPAPPSTSRSKAYPGVAGRPTERDEVSMFDRPAASSNDGEILEMRLLRCNMPRNSSKDCRSTCVSCRRKSASSATASPPPVFLLLPPTMPTTAALPGS
mmetsp:Transcript_29580/g.43325  ORF Transcript_29580/g.43325 Transcript_29580/m.43325 type:complete len:255 (-) Transcript_29580:212-976(-)